MKCACVWIMGLICGLAGSLAAYDSIDFGRITPSIEGTTLYDAALDQYTLVGTGRDLWNANSSGGRILYAPLSGDGEVIAAVERPVQAGLGQWARAGLGVFTELTEDSMSLMFMRVKEAASGTQASGNTQRLIIDARDAKANAVTRRVEKANDPLYADTFLGMRIVRRGDDYYFYYTNSTTTTWTELYKYTRAMGETINLGAVVSRNSGSNNSTAPVISNAFRSVVIRESVQARPISSKNQMEVRWVGDLPGFPTQAVTYTVQRSTARTGTFADLVTGVTSNVYVDTTIGKGNPYCYRVYAVAGGSNTLIGTGATVRMPFSESNAFVPADASAKGVYARYYSPATNFFPVAELFQSAVSNSWQTLSNIQSNSFKAQYFMNVIPQRSDFYSFVLDNGYTARLWLTNTLIIAQNYAVENFSGIDHSAVGSVASVPQWLEAGRSYTVQIEYQHLATTLRGPRCTFRWMSQTGGGLEIVADPTAQTIPAPWINTGMGTLKLNGGASYTLSNKVFSVAGSGSDIWANADHMRFVYQPLAGNFDFSARVVAQRGTHNWRKAGLMVRKSLSNTDVYFGTFQTPAGQTDTTGRWLVNQRRQFAGGASANTTSQGMNLPDFPKVPDGQYLWLRLTREGATVRSYARMTESGPWKLFEQRTDIALGETNYVGFAVTSHDDAQISTVDFDNVALLSAFTGSMTVSRTAEGNVLTLCNIMGTADYQQAVTGLTAQTQDAWASVRGNGVVQFDVMRANYTTSSFVTVGQISAETAMNGTFLDAGYVEPDYALTYYCLAARYPVEGNSEPLAEIAPLVSSYPNSVLAPRAESAVPTQTSPGLYFEYMTNTTFQLIHDVPPQFARVDHIGRFLNNDAAGLLPAGFVNGGTNFSVTMSGWIVPPVSGYYTLQARGDDGFNIFVNGQKVLSQTGYSNNEFKYSPQFYMEAGSTNAVYVSYFQGGGGANLQIKYKHDGMADYDFIPQSRQIPLTTCSLAQSAARLADVPGAWSVVSLSTNNRIGSVAVNLERTAFKIGGVGGDVWNAADACQYVYQTIGDDFDFTAEIAAMQTLNQYSKAGLMVRESSAADARTVALICFPPTAPVVQVRSTAGGMTTNAASAARFVWPIKMRLAYHRPTQLLTIYANDEILQTVLLDGWSKTLEVGLVSSSNHATIFNDAVFQKVALTVIPPKGAILILR